MPDDINNYYKEYYEKHGDGAYRLQGQPYTSRLRFIGDFLQKYVPQGGKVLDVGCGDGGLAERFPSYEWTGIDINTSQAKLQNKVTHDLMETPYPLPAKSFDGVVCSEVLEHLWSPEKVYPEARRLVKRGGIFLVSTPNFYWLDHLLNRFDKLTYRLDQSHVKEHIRQFDHKTHSLFMQQAGFKVVEHVGADSHYCPVFARVAQVIGEKVGKTEHEVGQWIGEAMPGIQHTVMLVGTTV